MCRNSFGVRIATVLLGYFLAVSSEDDKIQSIDSEQQNPNVDGLWERVVEAAYAEGPQEWIQLRRALDKLSHEDPHWHQKPVPFHLTHPHIKFTYHKVYKPTNGNGGEIKSAVRIPAFGHGRGRGSLVPIAAMFVDEDVTRSQAHFLPKFQLSHSQPKPNRKQTSLHDHRNQDVEFEGNQAQLGKWRILENGNTDPRIKLNWALDPNVV